MRSVLSRLLVLAVLAGTLNRLGHAQEITPLRLVEVIDIGQPEISPDGKKVAFRTEQASVDRNTYDAVWYVQNVNASSPPVRVADGGFPLRDSAGQSLPAPAVWSPNGRWIYYRAQIGGKIGVWQAAADGSGAVPVTLDDADVRDFSLSDDGETLRYSVGATRRQVSDAEEMEYDQGIHIDETVPVGQSLYHSGLIKGRRATQRFGKVWFDRAGLLSDVPDRWKAVDLASGATRGLDPSEIPPLPKASDFAQGEAEPWKFVLDRRNDRVALLTRVGDGAGLLEKPDVELSVRAGSHPGRQVTCSAASCEGRSITAMEWRPRSDEVLFTVTDRMQGLAQSIFGWNVGTGLVREVTHSRGLINGGRDPGSSCGVSPSAMVCVTAEADRPPRLERIDLNTGDRRILFDPNADLARDIYASTHAQLLRWTDDKGRQFSGQYFPARRSGSGLPPLFVSYYTCPGFLRGAYGDEWPLVPLAENGISAVCINDVPGYTLDAVERYDEGLQAIRSVIDLLDSREEIDRGKVGVGGLSYGSEVALWVATESRLAVAISISSPLISLDYYQFGSLKGEAFFSGLNKYWGLGAPDETPERWRIISPTFKLNRILAPVLMQMPEQEYMASLDYAIPLIRDHRADLYVFPDEPHQKFQPRHKLAVYVRNLDWFRFWLLGIEDESSAKASQYARWRLMRASKSVGQGDAPGIAH